MINVDFDDLGEVLIVNGGDIITISKGTYSSTILITTPLSNRYITNLYLTAEATGFIFNPETMKVEIGDFSASFKIGADKDLQEKAYAYTIAKTESFYRDFYNMTNNYVLFVVSNPVTIPDVANMTIPVGGCSLPIEITLPNVPVDNVSLVI